jgi:hypothetical protein
MTGREVKAVGVGRFPVHRAKWISDQIPAELHDMFGYRGEPGGTEDDHGQDEIEYQYEIKCPDGTPYRMPILVHYMEGEGIPIAFIIDEEITLGGDGATFLVSDWTSRRIYSGGGEPDYTLHEVVVRLPEKAEDCD